MEAIEDESAWRVLARDGAGVVQVKITPEELDALGRWAIEAVALRRARLP